MISPLSILKRKLIGFKKYEGTDIEICNRIVKDCYTGKYFKTSNGHFKDFYLRDFSWCIQPLINQNYKQEVTSTLIWAIKNYKKHNKITTTITPSGKPIDFFSKSADSLPSLLKCLIILDNKDLIDKTFIEHQAKEYLNLIDPNTGLIKENLSLSSIKDHYKRRSSVYDNCHTALLSLQLNQLKIENPLKEYNYKKIIKETFWNGSYFEEDKVSKNFSSEANLFPYYLNIFTEKEMTKKSITIIQDKELDKPFPLKYSLKRSKNQEIFIAKLVPNYEGNSIWAHIGLIYIDILSKLNKEKAINYLTQYKNLIETHKTFLEVYDEKGKPFSTLLYKTDEAMLWAAIYLELKIE